MATSTKLTENFALNEFTKGKSVNDYQLSLLKLLAENLQKLRNYLQQFAKDKKKAVCITISSGVRFQGDYERLKAAGYNPSATSDHFCGLQTLAKPTVGAADISVTNCTLSLKEVASRMIEMDKSSELSFGQIIYERNPAKPSEWIHVGNDWTKIFNMNVVKFSRSKYLMSNDNGKTYQTFKM